MKAEPVFGDQSLFDDAPEDCILVVMVPDEDKIFYLENNKSELLGSVAVMDDGVVKLAMRRIIAEPKRWTVEDQKAGRLPEVGCSVLFTRNNFKCEVIAIDDSVTEDVELALRFSDGSILVCKINKIKPIETPEEKAQRLREEWCSNALDSASILSGMREYDLKRLGGYIGNIYDALLSGDLPVPVKE